MSGKNGTNFFTTNNFKGKEIMNKYTLVIPSNILKASLHTTAKYDVRQYLLGVNIDIEYKEIQSTDGHTLTRIKCSDIEWDNESDYSKNIWIDRDFLEVFLKLCKHTKKQEVPKIKVSLDENNNVILENLTNGVLMRTNENQNYLKSFQSVRSTPIKNEYFQPTIFNLDLLAVYKNVLYDLKLPHHIRFDELCRNNSAWSFKNSNGKIDLEFIISPTRE